VDSVRGERGMIMYRMLVFVSYEKAISTSTRSVHLFCVHRYGITTSHNSEDVSALWLQGLICGIHPYFGTSLPTPE
jgi:hypothetical protein